MSSSTSRLILFYGGELHIGVDSVPTYYGGSNRPLRLSVPLTLSQLKRRILHALRVDSASHTVTLICRFPASGSFIASPIEDDESCEFILEEARGQALVVYVDIQKSPTTDVTSNINTSTRRDMILATSDTNEDSVDPEWNDQHTELVFHGRHTQKISRGHEQRRRSTSDVPSTFIPQRSDIDTPLQIPRYDDAGSSHQYENEGIIQYDLMNSDSMQGSSDPSKTQGFFHTNIDSRDAISGMCTWIRDGIIRIRNVRSESRNSILDQEVKDNKVYTCCIHTWNENMDKILWKSYKHTLHCVHIQKGDFLPLMGWESIQKTMEFKDHHIISIQHLQMRYFQMLRWKSGVQQDDSKINEIFSNLVLYRRWDHEQDDFLFINYDMGLKKPLPNGEKRQFFSGHDWNSLHEKFQHIHNCCPTLSQLKARALFLYEKYRWPR